MSKSDSKSASKQTAKLQAPRGCPDLLPQDNAKFDQILSKAKRWASLYGFETYKTPVFESAAVFTKTLGDTSDIITKEMYSFEDRNGELFILRPEATAPLVRLFISEKLGRSAPLKMFTYGPMFRYERPQKGRQRQFHQIGVEHIGAPKDLITHFEMLSFGWNFVSSLSLNSPIVIKINSIGGTEERALFKQKLIDYLTPLKDKLSEDSQKRLEENPLRILDSKSEEDRTLLEKAPKISDFLSDESKNEMKELISLCKLEGIEIEEDPFLVRGLDYYNDLVFEIVAENNLGAQNTILAGGRYDSLIDSMGGGDFGSIGWGAGVERLMLLSEMEVEKDPTVGLVFQDIEPKLFSETSNLLRKNGIKIFAPTSGNFSKKLLKCQKQNCSQIIIIGEDEIKNNTWTIKNMDKGEQSSYSPGDGLKFLKGS
jgi:histidyl-tRNA synthetase